MINFSSWDLTVVHYSSGAFAVPQYWHRHSACVLKCNMLSSVRISVKSQGRTSDMQETFEIHNIVLPTHTISNRFKFGARTSQYVVWHVVQ